MGASPASSHFPEARLIVERARAQLKEIQSLIAQWSDTNPYKILFKAERNGAQVTGYSYEASNSTEDEPMSAPPPEIALRVREFLHNLRPPLDYLVMRSATLCQIDEKDRRALSFPFGDTEAHFDTAKVRGKVKAMPSGLQDVIRDQRPWRERGNHPLWLVHELNRKDKHYEPLLDTGISLPMDHFARWQSAHAREWAQWSAKIANASVKHRKFLWASYRHQQKVPDELKVNLPLDVAIRFSDLGPEAPGAEEDLAQMVEAVSAVIDAFDAYFHTNPPNI